jgi:hypothetical protein
MNEKEAFKRITTAVIDNLGDDPDVLDDLRLIAKGLGATEDEINNQAELGIAIPEEEDDEEEESTEDDADDE